MAIEKMSYVTLSCKKDNLDEMLSCAMKSNLFSAETGTSLINAHIKGKLIQESNDFSEDISLLNSYASTLGISLDKNSGCTHAYTQEEIVEKLNLFKATFSQLSQNKSNSLSQEDEQALDLIRELGFSNIANLRYINVLFGRLPLNSLKKLALLQVDSFIYEIIQQNDLYGWILIACSDKTFNQCNEVLNTLYFEKIDIPVVDRKKLADQYREQLNDLYTYCESENDKLKLHQYVLEDDGLFYCRGFVASKDIEQFKTCFKDVDVTIEAKQDSEIVAPTRLKNNWFFKPFEMFVSMYSLPNYHEIDPTPFVAITYAILFGIMFSDVGQGALLFIGGLLLEKKTGNKLAGIVGRCGIFSMIFGFLFGSVFGMEELLVPVHKALFGVEHLFAPMDSNNTMTLLIGAVGIGMVLTLTCQSINVFTKFKQGQKAEAIYSQNGIMGLIFFAYIILMICNMMLGLFDGLFLFSKPFKIIFIVVPLLSFFLKERFVAKEEGESFKPEAGWGNYTLEAFFELFEVCLSFVTNTMSYLRVGGFVMSHAGMMLVVMTLLEMVGKAGPIVLVIGNLFVMVLEGLIVGIQTLRLEYYEMFSRYYVGGGKQFNLMNVE